jgi:hypothetical protein
MRSRIILLAVMTIGLLPGIMVAFISVLARLQKQPDDVIGGSRLPSCLLLTGFDTPIRTTMIPLLCLLAGIALYIGALVWMTKPVR